MACISGESGPTWWPRISFADKLTIKQIGGRAVAQLFVGDQLAGELKFVVVGEWRGADQIVEVAGFAVDRLGGAQDIAVAVLPFPVQIFFRALAVVEILRPLGKFAPIVGGSDPGAGFGIDPVGAVRREAAGENSSAIFERDAEDAGLALRGQLEFVAQSVGEQVVRRSAGRAACDAYQFRLVVIRPKSPSLLSAGPTTRWR